jgi:hypothetical protein
MTTDDPRAAPTGGAPPDAPPRRRLYVPAVGPRLRKVLAVVFGLFALLSVNSVYLVAVRVLEASTGRTYQNWFYIVMFLVHLVLGIAIVAPVVVFGILHLRNARNRPNRRAVRVGYALFATALVLLASGIVLTRIEGVIVVKDPAHAGRAEQKQSQHHKHREQHVAEPDVTGGGLAQNCERSRKKRERGPHDDERNAIDSSDGGDLDQRHLLEL